MSDFKLVKRGEGEWIKSYIPRRFEELIDTFGKESFMQMINSKDRPHVYLFKGMRGCGKTTTATVFAKWLNCTDLKNNEPCLKCDSCRMIADGCMDVVDINVADKRTLENARGLIESIRYQPSFIKNKVIILDEIQQMTKDAQESLLKAISDAGDRVYFILCTMEPEKVTPALASRCVGKFLFSPMTMDQKVDLIQGIATAEKIKLDFEDVEKIAYGVSGTPRDILAAMQLYKFGGLEAALIKDDEVKFTDFCQKLMKGKDMSFLQDLKTGKLVAGHAEAEGFRIGIATYFKSCMLNSRSAEDAMKFAKAVDYLTEPYYGGDAFNRLCFNIFRVFMIFKSK